MGELRNDIPLGEIDLSVLTNSGYTPTEISTAFSWLYEKIDLGENLVKEISKSSPHSHRVLHDAERMVFTPEAHGYLIQLRELGLISEEDIETVIDQGHACRLCYGGYAGNKINRCFDIARGRGFPRFRKQGHVQR